MSEERHIADAEASFKVVNITPDFCKVGKRIVAFDPLQILPHEKSVYAQTVFARSEKVLLQNSIIQGVKGNAGKGLQSGVSLGAGNVKILEGSSTVFIEDRPAARHNDLCEMNGA